MNNILVLCVGNICRSPMAEALLKQALPGINVYSAGIGALVGEPADPLAVQLMAEKGINISAHRAQQISSRLVTQAELILTMDAEQKKFVEKSYFSARGKIFRICEASKQDVADPYRQGLDSFRAALNLIEDGVLVMSRQIRQMN